MGSGTIKMSPSSNCDREPELKLTIKAFCFCIQTRTPGGLWGLMIWYNSILHNVDKFEALIDLCGVIKNTSTCQCFEKE